MPRGVTEASGVLIISDLKSEDSGVYSCTGSDLQSVAQDHATLIVETSDNPATPRVRIEPKYQTVKIGEIAEFKCFAEGYPQPVLTWHGGRNNILNPYSSFYEGIFRIPNVKKDDEAEYYCTAVNPAGNGTTRTLLLVNGGKL